MKKTLYLTGLLFLATVLSACSNKSNTNNSSTSTSIGSSIMSNQMSANEIDLGKLQNTGNNNQPANDKLDNSGKTSLIEIIKKGDNVKCIYEMPLNDMKTSGIVYIDGKNQTVRSDVKIEMKQFSGQTLIAHSIIKDKTAYSWTDMQPNMGIKIQLSEELNYITGGQDPNLKLQEKIDYKCDSWSVDEKIFELPKGSKFQDFSEMIKNMKNNMPKGEEACNLCDKIPDQNIKDNCKKANCK